jgi:hypothetical protein
MEHTQMVNGLITRINRTYLILSFIFFCHHLLGQEKLDSLIFWSDKMLNDTSEDSRIKAFEEVRKNILFDLNQNKNNFNLDFSKVKSISSLQSEDEKCRIITYNLRKKEDTYLYGGILQVFNTKTNMYETVELTDESSEISKPSYQTLKKNKWFGALYYKLWTVKYKKQKYYMLLGWDGNTAFSNKKLIDVFYFNNNNEIVFGAPIFEYNKKIQNRVFFEYAERVSMSLSLQTSNGKIIFDHLAPNQPSLEGQYEFYSPDFTTDAFEFTKGKWKWIPNYEARNEKEKK